MVTCDPLICDTKIPPMIAVKIPAITGNWEALAIAIDNGKAIIDTNKPEIIFCLICIN